MSWAKHAIKQLKNGVPAQIRPRGNSMKPKVNSGDRVTIDPCNTEDLQVDDIVLCRVRGRHYLHLIKAIDSKRFQIGNNRGQINGWIGPNSIFGKATKVEK